MALLMLMPLATVAGSAVTYRWVDADGVHYSDQPHQGADKIYLGQSQTYSSSQAQVTTTAPVRKSRATGDAAEFRYERCAVVQPTEDQVLLNAEGVTITVQLQPAKRSGDRVVLSFDGQAMQPASDEQTEFRITPLERGTHTVGAIVRDAAGKSLCQSKAVTFHARQPSVLAPQNPNRKH
jgi:hypothetical protein